jgi:hypothetical protein
MAKLRDRKCFMQCARPHPTEVSSSTSSDGGVVCVDECSVKQRGQPCFVNFVEFAEHL